MEWAAALAVHLMTNAAPTYDTDGGQQFTASPRRREIMVQIRHPIEASRRAPARALPRLTQRAGFWAVAFAFLAVSAFSTAPSSLYGLYEQQEHLSSLTITIVYAVYAIGIVVSLLLAGHVSDWYGRRAVMLPALAIAIAAAVVFLAWRSPPACSSPVCSPAWPSALPSPPPRRSSRTWTQAPAVFPRAGPGSWPRPRTSAAWPAVR